MNEQLSRGSNLNLPRGSYQSLLCRVNIPLMETTQQGAWWVRKAANAILQTVLSHPRDSERPPGRKRRRTFQLWDTRPLLRRPAAGRAVARQHLWVGCTPPSGQRDLPSKQEQAAGSKPLSLNYGGGIHHQRAYSSSHWDRRTRRGCRCGNSGRCCPGGASSLAAGALGLQAASSPHRGQTPRGRMLSCGPQCL